MEMNWMAEFFGIIWQMFSVQLPFVFNLTVGQICIGIFATVVSIAILKRLLQ